ncbi:enoyl-CoA hydratase/isomerase family protein [Anaerobacillus sp. MEB173]|uniref:enoyl-CoA hydratase/isomerase family protein n=1 Tax=Anaerobacillus sp. MEB173 TaxID=3383345 RepID=UPI003F91E49B
MNFETIHFEIKEEIAYITLNRPKQLNAVNRQMLSDLNDAIDIVESNNDIKVLIVTGNEDVFAAGADIVEITSFGSTIEFLETSHQGHEVLLRLENLDKPSIAVVKGFAFGGGCEISLACDFRIAADNARFGIPEIKLGLIPGWGGASRLQKLIPFVKFKEMLLTGDSITAGEAEAIGLVNKVVSVESAMEAGHELASRLTNKSAVALKYAKRLANTQLNTDLQTAIELEKQTIGVLFGTKDRTEGTNAFVEKRIPIWSNS